MDNFSLLYILGHTKPWEWQLGFNDNNILGWVTVFGYLISCLLCLFCAINVNKTKDKNSRWFWFVIAFVLLFLGINKQLDIQKLFLLTGRKAAWILGFYEQRRILQKGFILGIGITILSLFIITGKALGAKWKKCKLTLLGFLILMVFILLRGATFNNVFYSGYILPQYQWILELIGISLIGISALLNLRDYHKIIQKKYK